MMAEGAKVRVVRCPRCGKLLPELPNFTIYQCGSCGATLQAKRRGSETSQSSPAYSDDVNTRIMNSPDCSLEKKSIVASSASSETAGEGGRVEAGTPGIIPGEDSGIIPGKDSSSKLESTLDVGVEQIENRQLRQSKAPMRGLKPNGDKLLENKEEEEGTKVHADRSHSLHNKIRQTVKHEHDRGFALQRAVQARAERVSLKAPYPDEGSSSYHSKISRVVSLEEKQKIHFSNGIENLEQDRAELLRKLDELRDKLKQSGEATDLPREKRTSEVAYRVHRRPLFREGFSSSLTRKSAHHLPFAYEHNVEVPSFAIPDVPGYGEHLVPQMLGRANFQHHFQYPSRPLDNYLYGQFDPDPFISYHHDGLYSQTACTCVNCSTKHWQMPTQSSSNSRASYLTAHPRYHLPKKPSFASSHGHNQRLANAHLYSGESSRGQQKFQQRATSVKTKGQTCQPIAVNSKYKLQCGSCSEIISFELDGKRLVISTPAQPLNSITGTHENSNGRILDSSSSQNHSNGHQAISYSEGYDSPSYDIPSIDEKLVLPSPYSVASDEAGLKEYGLDMSGPHEVRGLPSSSSSSENVVSPDSMSCQQGNTSSAELPYKTDDTSHVLTVPLHEPLTPPVTDQIRDGPGKESRSRSDQEKILSINGNFKQNSVKNVLLASEMDVSPDEFPNASFSQDSFDESKDDDRPRNNKSGESFLAGLIKKSFRDFSRFNLESGRSKVSINGHPISDRLVIKAEKHAGPIHPGDYWYDYRAGFWGIMGNACLGIIPPFIEEFNYPMPKTCSGGNTGVFVNGRELHSRDLDLLVGRGLPATSGRSYIIELSGKVWDEDSGDGLDSLGKLAPTVEKVRHGFGMRASRIIA